MTIEQINRLEVNDKFFFLLEKLVDFSTVPEGEENYVVSGLESDPWYNRVELHTSLTKPSLEELEVELTIYKDELISIETERLRREDLQSRFNNLKDMRAVFHARHLSTLEVDNANPAVWIRDLLINPDKAFAENEIIDLETDDVDLIAVEITKQQDRVNKEILKDTFKEKSNSAITLNELKDMVKELLN